MIAEPQPLTEITQEVLRLLYRELSLVNTIHFLNQFTTGFGNYTEERRALLENQTIEEALADLHRYQASRTLRQQDLPTEYSPAPTKNDLALFMIITDPSGMNSGCDWPGM